MTDYCEEKRRRIEQFADLLRLMALRRHKVVKNDDCFLIFEEAAPEGIDGPQVEESAAIKVGGFADGGPAPDEDDTEDPSPHDWSPQKPFRFIQFAFGQDCFYLELPNNTIFPNEAELLLRQRHGFFWARNRPNLPWVRGIWRDIVRWDPLQKVYIYRDEASAGGIWHIFFWTSGTSLWVRHCTSRRHRSTRGTALNAASQCNCRSELCPTIAASLTGERGSSPVT